MRRLQEWSEGIVLLVGAALIVWLGWKTAETLIFWLENR